MSACDVCEPCTNCQHPKAVCRFLDCGKGCFHRMLCDDCQRLEATDCDECNEDYWAWVERRVTA